MEPKNHGNKTLHTSDRWSVWSIITTVHDPDLARNIHYWCCVYDLALVAGWAPYNPKYNPLHLGHVSWVRYQIYTRYIPDTLVYTINDRSCTASHNGEWGTRLSRWWFIFISDQSVRGVEHCKTHTGSVERWDIKLKRGSTPLFSHGTARSSFAHAKLPKTGGGVTDDTLHQVYTYVILCMLYIYRHVMRVSLCSKVYCILGSWCLWIVST